MKDLPESLSDHTVGSHQSIGMVLCAEPLHLRPVISAQPSEACKVCIKGAQRNGGLGFSQSNSLSVNSLHSEGVKGSPNNRADITTV